MGKLSVYEFQDYKKFILGWMEQAANGARGLRKQLADAIGCQTPFITHVLGGDYNLSLEQAEACARWVGLGDSETEFFLLLVIRQRSGTKSLANLASRQISQRRTSATVLKKRLNIDGRMNTDDQAAYYGTWYYAAVHMACLIPDLQTVESLRTYFNLSLSQTVSALAFLTEHGFIEEKKGRYKVLKPILHLEKESPFLAQHHAQWKLKALEAFAKRRSSDLFYSGVAVLSVDDYEWMREKLSQLLEEAVERIKASENETIACLNFDWFQL